MYDEMLHPTSWVVTESIDFLRRRDPTKPFFLMMSFHRPHPPLDPPQHYLDRYINKDLPDPVIGDWAPNELPVRGLDSPVPTDRDQIDMAPAVREYVLLELPDGPLCRDDCAGICPVCGIDRNEASCDCDTSVRDHRWAALDELRLDDD